MSESKNRAPTSDLILKITGTIVAVVIAALAMTTVLNVLRLEQTSEALLSARLSGIAREIQSTAHRGLDVGLSLSSMANLPSVLREYATSDPNIAAIVVHDCNGTTIASAGKENAAVGQGPWQSHLAEDRWTAQTSDTASYGLRILSSLGECAGGVAVTYDRRDQRDSLHDAVGSLTFNTLLAALAAVPAAVLTSMLLARRRRGLMSVFADLEALDGPDGDTVKAPPPDLVGGGGDVAAAYWQARPVLSKTLRSPLPPAPPPGNAEDRT